MTDNKKVSFWRIFWPSLIAGIVLIFVGFAFFSMIVGSIASVKPTYEVKANSILHLQLKEEIGEISAVDMNVSLSGYKSTLGLTDIINGLEAAANDKNIKGVFIELENAQCGYATAARIRQAIKEFEANSGKFVVAYHKGEAVGLKQYYIASAAGKNFGFSTSNMEFMGLGTEIMFLKGVFDKLGLEMQVVRGENNDFKSAVEPYFRNDMSDSSRLQIERYLENLWTMIKKDISEDRGVSTTELDRIADEALVRRMAQAVEYNLIDSVLYQDEVYQYLADLVEVDDIKKLNLVSFKKYAQKKFEADQEMAYAKKANVAVIVAEGEISVDGDGMASNRLTKLIRKARMDKGIKTIVLRINSPGGSALASEEMWREISLANEEKSVIVSMGDVAASGGYYIASASKRIFAQEGTITGSIGVFGVIPYTGKFLEDKVGVTFDRVGTNDNVPLTLNQKFTPKQFELIQDEVNSTYDLFLNRVATNRNMTKEQVNVVARGRVWTGLDAQRIGLVDEIGTLEDAIAYAVKEAEIADPIIRYYPKAEKEAWVEMLEDFFTSDSEPKVVKVETLPQELIDLYREVQKIKNMTGVQARMPYDIKW